MAGQRHKQLSGVHILILRIAPWRQNVFYAHLVTLSQENPPEEIVQRNFIPVP